MTINFAEIPANKSIAMAPDIDAVKVMIGVGKLAV
jgi:hypothetical protein